MTICFLKKSSGKKAEAAAAEPPKAKPSAAKEAEGAMEQVITPGAAEYASENRRLRNIQMVGYNFDDDGYYSGAQDQMYYYYPNHGSYHPHAVAAPPYHHGMRHMSRSMPPPFPHCDCDGPHSNYMPPLSSYAHYRPPPMPQPHFSPAPPSWQRFSPAPPPAPWGHFPRQQFGPPRRHFRPPGRPFPPRPSYDYYGD